MLQTEAEPISRIALRVAERGQVTPRDVLAMRRAVYSGDSIDLVEAETLMTLEHAIKKRHPAWDEFYVEVLTDFFRQDHEDFVIGDHQVNFLEAGILGNGQIADPTELRLLLNLIFCSTSCPGKMIDLARDALLNNIINSSIAVIKEGTRVPGTVDRHDVEAIRRLIYRRGSGMAISETEADWLIKIDRATENGDNHPEWSDLFVKAIAMYVLQNGELPDNADSTEANWLARHFQNENSLTPNGRALISHLRKETNQVNILSSVANFDY